MTDEKAWAEMDWGERGERAAKREYARGEVWEVLPDLQRGLKQVTIKSVRRRKPGSRFSISTSDVLISTRERNRRPCCASWLVRRIKPAPKRKLAKGKP